MIKKIIIITFKIILFTIAIAPIFVCTTFAWFFSIYFAYKENYPLAIYLVLFSFCSYYSVVNEGKVKERIDRLLKALIEF